jgi:hypothetical protein
LQLCQVKDLGWDRSCDPAAGEINQGQLGKQTELGRQGTDFVVSIKAEVLKACHQPNPGGEGGGEGIGLGLEIGQGSELPELGGDGSRQSGGRTIKIGQLDTVSDVRGQGGECSAGLGVDVKREQFSH